MQQGTLPHTECRHHFDVRLRHCHPSSSRSTRDDSVATRQPHRSMPYRLPDRFTSLYPCQPGPFGSVRPMHTSGTKSDWGGMARQRHSDNDRSANNHTAEATLLALTTQICGFLHERALDSRCASKLVRRLRKEAETVSEAGRMTKSGQKDLLHAFNAVDAVLQADDAGLLVAANTALRATAGAPGTTDST